MIEPIAWMNPNTINHGIVDARTYKLEGFTPLYAHPQKELTDEEIFRLWQKFLDEEISVFARAILKKASEK